MLVAAFHRAAYLTERHPAQSVTDAMLMEAALTDIGFDPVRHGFHFANDFVNEVALGLRTRGLCGGMSLAAGRYFRHRRQIPPQRVMPRPGSPLHNYIYHCQMQSYGPLGVTSALNWVTAFGFDAQFGWCANEYARTRRAIDSGEPIVLGLRSRQPNNPFGGHQVLAIGYEESPRKVLVYDPNYPDEMRAITFVADRRRLAYGPPNEEGNENIWSSFFITGCAIGNELPPQILQVN